MLATPRVTVHYNTGVDDAYGDAVLGGLKIKDVASGAVSDLPVAGLFYGIGHTPNSGLVKDQVELDDAGYVKVGVFKLCVCHCFVCGFCCCLFG